MILENEALKIYTDFNTFTEHAMNVYKYTNQEFFQDFSTIYLFEDVLNVLFAAHKQFPNVQYTRVNKPSFPENNRVLVCCSSGLDSVFQALYLREEGFDVELLHVDNLNAYSNGQEKKCFIEFAEHFGFKYYTPKVTPKRNNGYKKHWQENSFKNFLIYSIAIDYMLNNNICFLSGGDDLRLTLKNSVLGTNTSDCVELTHAFVESFGVNFLPIDRYNKAERLQFLDKLGANDYYLSCVGPGRLIKVQHDRYENKFNVKLDKWCCGSCRKDAMHILLRHYYLNQEYPPEFIQHCWEKISIGADNVFFDLSIPLEKRIKNLIEY